MTLDGWPLWKRAVALNIVGIAGVAIGFASSDVRLSPKFTVPIVVFTLAVLNFLFLVVRPQLVEARVIGQPGVFLQVLVRIVRQRPLIILLVINQLIGVSQLLVAATTLAQLLISGRIHTLPNASTINLRMIPVSASAMAAVAAIWLLSAVGLWRSRSWAWWLTMLLNALVVVGPVAVELMAHKFLFGWRETIAAVACVLLLLPVVRNDVRRGSRNLA